MNQILLTPACDFGQYPVLDGDGNETCVQTQIGIMPYSRRGGSMCAEGHWDHRTSTPIVSAPMARHRCKINTVIEFGRCREIAGGDEVGEY
jgi:hypothetical protein